MENKFGLIGRVLMYFLMAAGVLITIIIMRNGDILKDFDLSVLEQQSIMNWTILIAGLALGITALLTLAFPLISMLMNPKALLRMLAVLGGLGLIYAISYGMADSTLLEYMLDGDYKTSEQGSKLVGSFLYLTYIIGGLAVITTIGASVMNLFKR